MTESGGTPRVRKVGIWIATALVVGNMVGSGVFLLPASLAPFGGISILGWLFTSAGALTVALLMSRLARLMPKVGGPYAYTRGGLGDLPGFLVAWGYWISIWSGNAAISVAFVGYLAVFFPTLAEVPAMGAGAALTAIWLLTGLNVWGVREAGIVQFWTTVLKATDRPECLGSKGSRDRPVLDHRAEAPTLAGDWEPGAPLS
jgi:APA family basic amino acid/polyamine antiporter